MSPPLGSQPLLGETALVTGGSRGLGRAIALRLAQAGCDLIIHYHQRQDAAEAVKAEIEHLGGRARIVQADLRSREQIALLFARVNESPFDILVNNAGVWKFSPLGTTTAETMDEIVNLNLKSVFWLTQLALSSLRDGGRIVNISSVAGRIGIRGGRSLYAATKAAVDALTRNWALELAPRQIRVNAVAPGYVLTDMTAARYSDPDVYRRDVSRHPFGRIGEPDDVADAVVFLCSPAARWVTGQSINVSGGFVI
jgi:NAD(P)-dependent dehydrogenase (short-subunit alcohol dehydrogenase family)